MDTSDDLIHTGLIEKALEIKRAFGDAAGRRFLEFLGISELRARAALDRYERRRGERRALPR